MTQVFSVRKFTDDGLVQFEHVIEDLRSGNIDSIPNELIFGEKTTEPFNPTINIEKRDYINKIELVPYLVSVLQLKENIHLYFNKELWSWLAGFFFDNICPPSEKGHYDVKESAFYILRDPKNYNKYYRHILAYPCRLFSELGDSAKIFLTGTFSKRGELTEQFGAYQEIALNKGIVDAAGILYWNEKTGNLKRGAAGKGAGSARRLIRIIRQYQMTYDLNSMNGNEIVELLPTEFDKWKNQ